MSLTAWQKLMAKMTGKNVLPARAAATDAASPVDGTVWDTRGVLGPRRANDHRDRRAEQADQTLRNSSMNSQSAMSPFLSRTERSAEKSASHLGSVPRISLASAP